MRKLLGYSIILFIFILLFSSLFLEKGLNIYDSMLYALSVIIIVISLFVLLKLAVYLID